MSSKTEKFIELVEINATYTETKEQQLTKILASKIFVDCSLGGSRGERGKGLGKRRHGREKRKSRMGGHKCRRSTLLHAPFPLLSTS